MTIVYFEELKNSPNGWKMCAEDFTQKLHSDDHVQFFCLQMMESHVKTGHASSSDDDILALRKTIVYFEELKNSPNGWKMCAEDFTQKLHSDDHVRFFCLQMMESHVKTGHASSSDDDILALRKVLLLWMQDHQRIFREDARFLKSKIAQIFALTFIVDYPLKWPTFFSDLLEIVESGDVWSVELYLRVLLAIDSEVVDRQIVHTQEENARNTDIKDHMRAHCVLGLVESWLQIMTVFEEKDHGVVCLVLEVVGAYVSWVDVNLIANDRCISLLLKYLSVSTLRESAVDTLHEIISKGMDPPAKIKLVESLCKILESVGVLGTTSNQEEEDPDFQGKLSKFVNGMGCALVTSWNKLLKADDEANAREALVAIDRKLPYLHRFLSDEDDGVSETVIEFAVQYIGVLKQRSNLSDNDRLQLQSLLTALVNKLKYDEDYNFDSEGEEEIMFIDYRKQLKVLFDNIAQLDPYLVLQATDAMLSSVLSNITSEPFMNVELVLRVFHMIGEVITSKQYGAVNVSGSIWHKMMTTVLQSSAGCHEHTAVVLQYYEIVVRYDKFFQLETQYIPPVLEGFLGVHGLRHRNSAVRSRLSYLLVRFIKSLKSQLGGIAEQVLTNLRELLLMLPGTPNYSTYLSTNDMMFMYEIAGILIVFSQQTPEAKGALMAGVISPLVDKYQQYILQITKVEDVAKQEELAKVLYNLISFASRASKAFPNHQQAKQNGCVQCFAEPLSVFLQGLEVGVQRDTLQSGVRQYLHRMIICLGDELLKYVPMAVSLLLKDCKSRDIQEFIPLVNQLIVKYKQLVAPILQEVFFPVCQHILTCINLPCDPSDLNEVRDRQNLKKCYYLFISSVATNSVTDVMASQGGQSLQEVLGTVVNGAVNFPEPSVQKVCFGILKKLVEVWGSGESVSGFVEYMYEHILTSCFSAPLKPTFDLNDGHTFLALGEIAGIMKAMLTSRGDEFVLYLQTKYFPSIELPAETGLVLVSKIQSTDIKLLKNYLKVLFTNLRTT